MAENEITEDQARIQLLMDQIGNMAKQHAKELSDMKIRSLLEIQQIRSEHENEKKPSSRPMAVPMGEVEEQ